MIIAIECDRHKTVFAGGSSRIGIFNNFKCFHEKKSMCIIKRKNIDVPTFSRYNMN
mgnify:CR=1 FL=1